MINSAQKMTGETYGSGAIAAVDSKHPLPIVNDIYAPSSYLDPQEPFVQKINREPSELVDGLELPEVHDLLNNHEALGPVIESSRAILNSSVYIFGSTRNKLMSSDGVEYKYKRVLEIDLDAVRRDREILGEPISDEYVLIDDDLLEWYVSQNKIIPCKVDINAIDHNWVREELGLDEDVVVSWNDIKRIIGVDIDEEDNSIVLEELTQDKINQIAQMPRNRALDTDGLFDIDTQVVACQNDFKAFYDNISKVLDGTEWVVEYIDPKDVPRDYIVIGKGGFEIVIDRVPHENINTTLVDSSDLVKDQYVDQYSREFLFVNDRVMLKTDPEITTLHDPAGGLNGIVNVHPPEDQFSAVNPDNRESLLILNEESKKYELVRIIEKVVIEDREPTLSEWEKIKTWEFYSLMQQVYRLGRREVKGEHLVRPGTFAAQEVAGGQLSVEAMLTQSKSSAYWYTALTKFVIKYNHNLVELLPEDTSLENKLNAIHYIKEQSTKHTAQALSILDRNDSIDSTVNLEDGMDNHFSEMITRIHNLRYLFPGMIEEIFPGIEDLPLYMDDRGLGIEAEKLVPITILYLEENNPTIPDLRKIVGFNRLRTFSMLAREVYLNDNPVNHINAFIALMLASANLADKGLTVQSVDGVLNESLPIGIDLDFISRCMLSSNWIEFGRIDGLPYRNKNEKNYPSFWTRLSLLSDNRTLRSLLEAQNEVSIKTVNPLDRYQPSNSRILNNYNIEWISSDTIAEIAKNY